ncbi:sulfatase [Stieleria marina]|uniref:Arylsulfatase n=1 Tax=Stieleria marina TaxID=1930275 RepID=A0A517NS09_9BACT|nr:Arylsulfatase [Planctomycetes bacterium K23_9]
MPDTLCAMRTTLFVLALSFVPVWAVVGQERPNIVLVMADDQGWGQTGYYNHPVLKTPHLDAMASSGIRFDRFYAGAPVCSPTRGCVLTGRANDRIGVLSHGYALRRQEITIASLLAGAGYATGHFGKWHLNGIRGPGVPVLHGDTHHPGKFGFQSWLSVTNFFDRDPILSRRGKFEEFEGDSSEIVIDEALKFMRRQHKNRQPFFAVVWYGTPHDPFKAADDDAEAFADLDPVSRQHYGELVAMDRSIGTLRSGLREMNVADNTIVWFCSDNGGLAKIKPDTVGGLRGNKGSVYEGGLRVPGIIEWPASIQPRTSLYPASVLDILPTLLDVTGVEYPDSDRPLDGISLTKLFDDDLRVRHKPIPFRHTGKAALVDNRFKLVTNRLNEGGFELYDIEKDPKEKKNISEQEPVIAQRMRQQLLLWSESVDHSADGKDYPEGQVDRSEPVSRFWMDMDEYKPFFGQWKSRWEYAGRLDPESRKKRKRKTAQ